MEEKTEKKWFIDRIASFALHPGTFLFFCTLGICLTIMFTEDHMQEIVLKQIDMCKKRCAEEKLQWTRHIFIEEENQEVGIGLNFKCMCAGDSMRSLGNGK